MQGLRFSADGSLLYVTHHSSPTICVVRLKDKSVRLVQEAAAVADSARMGCMWARDVEVTQGGRVMLADHRVLCSDAAREDRARKFEVWSGVSDSVHVHGLALTNTRLYVLDTVVVRGFSDQTRIRVFQ